MSKRSELAAVRHLLSRVQHCRDAAAAAGDAEEAAHWRRLEQAYHDELEQLRRALGPKTGEDA